MQHEKLIKRILSQPDPFMGVKRKIGGPFSFPRHAMIVFMIKKHEHSGGITVNQFAELWEVSPSAVTQLVNRAEEEGLITRSINSHNRRKVDLTLTEKGEDLFQSAMESIIPVLDSLIDEIGEQEFTHFLDTLGKIMNFLEKETE